MPCRRDVLLASLGLCLLPAGSLAAIPSAAALSWHDFVSAMQALADRSGKGSIEMRAIAAQGVRLLQQLDVADDEFLAAGATAWESGNRFWFWQRLTRATGLNGGILTVEQGQDVPLHDHPGATGMLRVLTGTLEVWQFDRHADAAAVDSDRVLLQRVSRQVLRPGDTAVLMPEQGNIHALRALTPECSMLDYFIPPYERSRRTWYRPEERNWFDAPAVACSPVSEADYYTS